MKTTTAHQRSEHVLQLIWIDGLNSNPEKLPVVSYLEKRLLAFKSEEE